MREPDDDFLLPLQHKSGGLATSALDELAKRLEIVTQQEEYPLPSSWLEEHFYVPRPRDPITGEVKGKGPIILADHQRRIVNEALARDNKGLLKYTTVIYSAPKKSGKSTLSSGVALYMAEHNDYGKIYCAANDGKSSRDRLYGPIYVNFRLHRSLGGIYSDINPNKIEVTLPNYANIEAIPCDAAGEAGAEPTGVFYSELWGFTTDAKRQLFTELTIPPTLHGYAIRWIESYAGFMGQSDLLWELYNLGVNEGEPHPDFLDLVDDQGRPVVWVNEDAGMFCYWDHVPRMVWQTEEYYDEERRLLSHSEFQRVHRNVWVSPVGSFIESEWWDACRDDTIPPFLSNDTPAVVGIDAATAEGGDCAAIVLVTRDPHSPLTDVAVRRARVFKGERGKINLSETIGKTLREWAKEHNIVCVVYDPFQMENMIRNFQDGKVLVTHQEIAQFNSENEVAAYIDGERKAVQLWYKPFSQHGSRALADKRLYDMILNRQIHWTDVPGEDIIERDGADTLSQHIKQTGAKETGGKMRLEKLSREAHNDAAVALSMATHQCMYLQLDNKEFDEHRLLKKLSRDELTMAEFQRIMESRRIGQQANG